MFDSLLSLMPVIFLFTIYYDFMVYNYFYLFASFIGPNACV